MKSIAAKIIGLVMSVIVATSAFAWTPTVNVQRDANNATLNFGWGSIPNGIAV